MIKISPSVLKWARYTSYGQRIDEVAAKLKIDKSAIEEWESKEQEMSISMLKKVSKLYRRNISVLLLDNPPKSMQQPKFRRLPDVLSADFDLKTIKAIREAQEIQLATKSLIGEIKNGFLQGLESHILNPVKTAEEAVLALNIDEDTRQKGKDAREQLNIWKNILQKHNVIVCEMSYPTTDSWGFALADEVCPTIVLNTSTTYNAKIFTLFHELGHIILKQSDIDFEFDLIGENSDSSEVWCNSFSANLLVPENLFVKFIPNRTLNNQVVIEMAKKLRVSTAVIWRRALDMGYVTKSKYRLIHEEMKSFRSLPVINKHFYGASPNTHLYVKIKSKSGLFISTVLNAYSENKIGYTDMINYLKIKEIYLERLQRLMFA